MSSLSGHGHSRVAILSAPVLDFTVGRERPGHCLLVGAHPTLARITFGTDRTAACVFTTLAAAEMKDERTGPLVYGCAFYSGSAVTSNVELEWSRYASPFMAFCCCFQLS